MTSRYLYNKFSRPSNTKNRVWLHDIQTCSTQTFAIKLFLAREYLQNIILIKAKYFYDDIIITLWFITFSIIKQTRFLPLSGKMKKDPNIIWFPAVSLYISPARQKYNNNITWVKRFWKLVSKLRVKCWKFVPK